LYKEAYFNTNDLDHIQCCYFFVAGVWWCVPRQYS
jgi:hypothetical protein